MRMSIVLAASCAGLWSGVASAAPPEPSLTTFVVEAGAGVSTGGNFVEQRIEGDERELDLGMSFAGSAAFGINPAKNLEARLGYTFSGSNLAFDDDSGFGGDARDIDDLDNLFANIISLEGIAFFWNQHRRVVAYGIGGFNGTIWALDEVDEPQSELVEPGDSDALFRVGASAGLGLQVRAIDELAVRLEWNNLALGNPFDGGDAYRVNGGGVLFSEPEVVRLARFTLGVAWTFGPPGDVLASRDEP